MEFRRVLFRSKRRGGCARHRHLHAVAHILVVIAGLWRGRVTDARLTTAIRVSALIRRVNSEGGHATVLSKGDATAGAILLILCERGRNQRFFERTLDQNGAYRWGRTDRKSTRLNSSH